MDTGTGSTGAVRVVLVDDEQLVRTGFRLVLSGADDVEVVGEAADVASALDLVPRLAPDVVLMDLRLGDGDGVAATARLAELAPDVRVVVVTSFGSDDAVFGALAAGASGFLLKDATPEQLVEAVRCAARGDALLAPSVTRTLISAFARGPVGVPRPDRAAGLTEREREVLVAVADGLSNAEVAARLFVSEATVKTHVAALLRKLGLRDRVQLVVHAYRTGLVD